MKIRTSLELQDSLQKDIKWRKREFISLSFMIKSSRGHEKQILIRAAIVLLYAHWEGHIKHCALAYINFLNNKGLPFHRIRENFLLLSVPDKFRKGFSLNKISSLLELHDYVKSPPVGNFKVDENLVVNTDSNLKFPTLLNILQQLGLDSSSYDLKEHFIDSKLVRCRNAIAHGDILGSTDIEETYEEIKTELLNMILLFQNLIFKAVDNQEYLK